MQEVIEQLRHLSSAEDFLRFFDIAFDEKVVNVSRLHILKRFFQCIEQQKELPCNSATAVLAVYRCLLQKADNDFVVSTPAKQKVFKVFWKRTVGGSSQLTTCARRCRHAAAPDLEYLNAYCRLHQTVPGFRAGPGSPCHQHYRAPGCFGDTVLYNIP
ncbi:nitrogen fixation protein NifW [Paraburkholderia sp. BL9I2N2]|nr:nitrogen fixation protein NifW [Paraburkholderia sp. BL9I2N2]